MDFEWDPAKAASNRRKHGIDFAEAAMVLTDPLAVTIPEPDAAEERHVTIGSDAVGRILVVVWAPRKGGIRIISARIALARERRDYEGG